MFANNDGDLVMRTFNAILVSCVFSSTAMASSSFSLQPMIKSDKAAEVVPAKNQADYRAFKLCPEGEVGTGLM
jgi:hypothetical protein